MVTRQSLPSEGTNNAITLRGQFILPYLTEQGMEKRLGRGRINNVIPLTDELVVVYSSSGAALWNSINNEILWEIDNPATGGVLNSDGTLLALSWNQYIYLWDLATGQLLRRLEGNYGNVLSIAMSPDPHSKLLASVAEKENIIRLWDLESGQEIRQLKGHFEQVNSLTFSPDGKRLASGGKDWIVNLWEVPSGQLLQQLENGILRDIKSLGFNPDGNLLVSDDLVWEMTSEQQILQMETKDVIHRVAFSWDAQILACAGNNFNERITLWDVESGKELRKLEGDSGVVTCVAFTPDNQKLISGSENGKVQLWDVSSGAELQRLEGSNAVTNIAISSDGKFIVSGSSYDPIVRLWDVASGQELRRLERHSGKEIRVSLSPDDRLIVSAALWTDKVILWDVESGQEIQQLEGGCSQAGSLAFSPDGKILALASRWSNEVELWDMESRKKMEVLLEHDIGYRTGSIAFSPDGKLLACGNSRWNIWLWDTNSWQQLQQLEGDSEINSIAFSPDGKLLASSSFGFSDNKLWLWDVVSGQKIRRLECDIRVETVAFSSDGILASGGWDNKVRLWDVASGQEIQRLEGHTNTVTAVVFSSDGKLLASSSGDGTIKLWRITV